MTYGKRLEAAMQHANKTRRQLSDALGCTPQTVGVVITWTGEVERKLSTAYHEAAARYLRVNSHWLSTGEGEMLEKCVKVWDMAASNAGTDNDFLILTIHNHCHNSVTSRPSHKWGICA